MWKKAIPWFKESIVYAEADRFIVSTAEQKFSGKDIDGGVLNSTQFGMPFLENLGVWLKLKIS